MTLGARVSSHDAMAEGVAIIVFARRPSAGRVKTRLARSIGKRRAAAVYAGLLGRTIETVEDAAFERRWLMPESADEAHYFRSRFAHRGWQVRTQCRGHLGRRMERALKSVMCDGGAAVLIGSDIADFIADDLVEARRALAAGADAVIGPVRDGGYWLIGASRVIHDAFCHIPWSTARVFERTIDRFKRHRLEWVTLAERHDVDTPGDLRYLTTGSRSDTAFQRKRLCSRSSRATQRSI